MHVANALISSVFELISMVLNFYVWLLVVGAILSWLVAFNVLNTQNQLVHTIGDFVYRLTEPLLKRIRKVLPSLGGLDLSPLVLIFAIMFLQSFLRHLVYG